MFFKPLYLADTDLWVLPDEPVARPIHSERGSSCHSDDPFKITIDVNHGQFIPSMSARPLLKIQRSRIAKSGSCVMGLV
jgi:hypothetical protein